MNRVISNAKGKAKMRNLLKAIGLAAIAALATGVVLATTTQAEENIDGYLTAGETEGVDEHTATILHGAYYGTPEANYFLFQGPEGPQTTCTNTGITFSGSEADGTAWDESDNFALTLTPTYKECEADQTSPMTVDLNGCDYTYLKPTKVGEGEYKGDSQLWCPKDTAIDVTVFSMGNHTEHSGFVICTTRLGNPAGGHTELGGHVTYKRSTHEPTAGVEKDYVTVQATVNEIPWARMGLCSNAEGTDGAYGSKRILTGSDAEGNHHDVWISDTPTVG